ncbi:MAG: DegQ family serine endoprotease [Ghiorsea sp.]
MKNITQKILVSAILIMLPVLSHAMPSSFADLAAEQKPSVVNISTTQYAKNQTRQFKNPFGQMPGSPFEDFFRDLLDQQPPAQQERHALGTGFILSKKGYIVTNNHVVKDADEIVVTNSQGEEFEAILIGTDAKLDLALLKISSQHVRAVKLGNSDQLRVGDWVVAIGNPFGLEQTVTAGIVSAKGRVIGSGPYDDFIQTDAAINPGNSGGPLFNSSGEVIGINTAIMSQSGGNNGIGFAIPINLAKSVFKDLRENGHVQRARLGVRIQDVDKETMKALGLKSRAGALVPQVEAGSAADKAGIQAGDVIVSIDGKKIRKSHDLPIKVARHSPGDQVNIVVIRNGKRKAITVIVEAMPTDGVAMKQHSEHGLAQHGMAVEPLTDKLIEQLRVRSTVGVVVQQIRRGSPAARAGIERGDVVLRVDGNQVKNVRDFNQYAATLGKGHALRVLLDRHGNQVFTIILPPRAR